MTTTVPPIVITFSDQNRQEKSFKLEPNEKRWVGPVYLQGEGSALYGSAIAESMLNLLERYSSPTDIELSHEGISYYNQTNDGLKICIEVSPYIPPTNTSPEVPAVYEYKTYGRVEVGINPPTSATSLWLDQTTTELHYFNEEDGLWDIVGRQYISLAGTTITGEFTVTGPFVINSPTSTAVITPSLFSNNTLSANVPVNLECNGASSDIQLIQNSASQVNLNASYTGLDANVSALFTSGLEVKSSLPIVVDVPNSGDITMRINQQNAVYIDNSNVIFSPSNPQTDTFNLSNLHTYNVIPSSATTDAINYTEYQNVLANANEYVRVDGTTLIDTTIQSRWIAMNRYSDFTDEYGTDDVNSYRVAGIKFGNNSDWLSYWMRFAGNSQANEYRQFTFERRLPSQDNNTGGNLMGVQATRDTIDWYGGQGGLGSIVNCREPVTNNDAATKNYVDNALSNNSVSGLSSLRQTPTAMLQFNVQGTIESVNCTVQTTTSFNSAGLFKVLVNTDSSYGFSDPIRISSTGSQGNTRTASRIACLATQGMSNDWGSLYSITPNIYVNDSDSRAIYIDVDKISWNVVDEANDHDKVRINWFERENTNINSSLSLNQNLINADGLRGLTMLFFWE